MKSIIKHFIHHPVLANSLVAVLLFFGVVSLWNMKTTFFPEVPSRIIMVQATYPGASPGEIEEGITLKVEDKLKGLTGVDRVTSVSSENSAVITVELETGVDANVLLVEVKNAVDQISTFPVGMEQIKVFKQEMIDFVISFALYGDVDLTTLKTLARRVERDFLASDGISKVSLSGFPSEEIEIAFREDDLRRYGLTFQEAAAAVSNANIKSTGGKIRGTQEELLIRADSKGYYAKDLEAIVLRTSTGGAVIRLGDVADVQDRWSEDPNRRYYNGKSAVIIDVNKTITEDLNEIAEYVNAYIDEFNESHETVQADVFRDGSKIVQERVDILSSNGAIGILLVILFLSLSLHPRLSFWVALSIPLSLAGMFMIGSFYGLTINVMSLMAMILVLGILVDDGIVIAENIYQHHERGESRLDAAINGTLEVLPSVFAAILTTVVIFAAFFFLEGHMGDNMVDVAFVVIAALLISLVEAVLILPAHVAHSKAMLVKHDEKHSLLDRAASVLDSARERVYEPLLRFSIKHPVLSLMIPAALFVVTIGALAGGVIKTTIFPIIEGDNVAITLQLPAGTRDTVTDSLLQHMETEVWSVNETYKEQMNVEYDVITAISRTVGTGTHQGRLRASLISSEERELSSFEMTNMIRDAITPIPQAERLQVGGGTRWGMPVSVSLQSQDLEQLREAKEELKQIFGQNPKLKDVIDNDPPGLREVVVELNDNGLALGLTPGSVMQQVRAGFFGSEAQRIIRGIDEVRIWVRYAEGSRASLQDLSEMRIRVGSAEYPLSAIANLRTQRGVISISHIDAQREVKVEADIANAKESVTNVLSEIETDVMPPVIDKYPDVQFQFEGQSRESGKTMGAFMVVVPVMLILMFIIIVFTFRSSTQALVVFALIPFAFIGVAWGHFIQGYIMSMLSLFGMLALIGIVVNDSLVLVTTFNRLMKQGMAFEEAVLEAGLSRFRPVLLTSVTTIAGLAPLIFEGSHQAQFLSPMAISVAYGLLFGTVITLLVLPSLLVVLNHLRVFLSKWRREGPLTAEQVEPAVQGEQFSLEG